jgi:hypothetical protein
MVKGETRNNSATSLTVNKSGIVSKDILRLGGREKDSKTVSD